jgi:hypothetical protein
MVTDAGEGTGNCIFPLSRYHLYDNTCPRYPDGLWGGQPEESRYARCDMDHTSKECGMGGEAKRRTGVSTFTLASLKKSQ